MNWLSTLQGWQQALLATSFTYLMTAFGAMLVFLYREVSNKTFTIMLSSSAGIMIASTFFSLLLPAIEQSGEGAWWILTLSFVLGGALILMSDYFVQRLNLFSNDRRKQQSASLCVAVTAHNIPEGLAIGVAFGALSSGSGVELISTIMLAVGIGIQNFPEGMCVAFPLRANGLSRLKSFMIGQLSGLVEVFSGVVGALAVTIVTQILPWALAFSAGAMIAVVCSELIPESFAQDKTKATLGVVLGFSIMMLLDLAFG